MIGNVPLYCPKCGERANNNPANVDTNKPFTCICGGVTPWGELKTATGKKLADHAADMFRNKLKGIKGVKPRG